MPDALRLLGQIALYGATAAALGVGATLPKPAGPDPTAAFVTVSFVHGGARAECRRLSPEELRRLAPNMRRPVACARERTPVTVEVTLDGRVVIDEVLPPAGLSGDGPSRIYRRISIPAGPHRLSLRLADTPDGSGAREGEFALALRPGQNLVVDFVPERGGFVLR